MTTEKAAADQPREIEIDHARGVELLRLPIPKDGGIVLVRGRCGSGKTTVIDCVKSLSDPEARKRLEPTDHAPHGTIRAPGMTVRIGRSRTSVGELEMDILDASNDPLIFVDPGIKDLAAADRRRLQTLVRLSGVTVPAEKWKEFASDAGIDISPILAKDDDPVVVADKLRRKMHEKALEQERLRDTKEAEAATKEQTVQDVDVSSGGDSAALNQVLSAAIERRSAIRSQREAAREAATEAQQARERLEKLDQPPGLDTLEEAIEAAAYELEKEDGHISGLEDKINELTNELKARLSTRKDAANKMDRAIERKKSAEQLHSTLNELSASIESLEQKAATDPGDDAIMGAESAVEQAQSAVERADTVRRAIHQREQAEELRTESKQAAQTADTLRTLARSTDTVLESIVADMGLENLQVRDGRIYTTTPRGTIPVSELSTGELTRIALEMAARNVKMGGLVPCDHEAFQALDPELQAEVASICKELKIVLFTGQVDSGKLRVEVM